MSALLEQGEGETHLLGSMTWSGCVCNKANQAATHLSQWQAVQHWQYLFYTTKCLPHQMQTDHLYTV